MAWNNGFRRGNIYKYSLWADQINAGLTAETMQNRMKQAQERDNARLVLWLYLCSVYDALRPAMSTPTNDNGQPVKLVAPHYVKPNIRR